MTAELLNPFYERAVLSARRIDSRSARDNLGDAPTAQELARLAAMEPGVGGTLMTIIAGTEVVRSYVTSDSQSNVVRTRFARKSADK